LAQTPKTPIPNPQSPNPHISIIKKLYNFEKII